MVYVMAAAAPREGSGGFRSSPLDNGNRSARTTGQQLTRVYTDYPAWAELQKLYDASHTKLVLKDLFASDPSDRKSVV